MLLKMRKWNAFATLAGRILSRSWLRESETAFPWTPRQQRDRGRRPAGVRGLPVWLRRRPPSVRRRGICALSGLVATLMVLGGGAYLAALLDPLPPRNTGMARASDGDSLRLRNDRIRLLGIDAPELDQVCWDDAGDEWPCGLSSQARLSEILDLGQIACQPNGHDRYGRILATCESDGRDIGALLVSEGWAIADGAYRAEQAAARAAGLGIWRGRFVDPRQWRDQGPVNAPEPSTFDQIWNWFRELTGATTLR